MDLNESGMYPNWDLDVANIFQGVRNYSNKKDMGMDRMYTSWNRWNLESSIIAQLLSNLTRNICTIVNISIFAIKLKGLLYKKTFLLDFFCHLLPYLKLIFYAILYLKVQILILKSYVLKSKGYKFRGSFYLSRWVIHDYILRAQPFWNTVCIYNLSVNIGNSQQIYLRQSLTQQIPFN